LKDKWTIQEIKAYGEAFIRKALQYTADEFGDFQSVLESIRNGPEELDDAPAKEEVKTLEGTNAPKKEEGTKEEVKTLEGTIEGTKVDIIKEGKQEEEVKEEIVEPKTESFDFDKDPSLDNIKLSEYFARNAISFIKTLENIVAVGDCVREMLTPGDITKKILKELTTSKHVSDIPPAKWWRDIHDFNLLLGFLRHGMGCYDLIIADPDLCFKGNVRLPTKEEEVAMEEKSKSDEEKEEKPKEEGKDEKTKEEIKDEKPKEEIKDEKIEIKDEKTEIKDEKLKEEIKDEKTKRRNQR